MARAQGASAVTNVPDISDGGVMAALQSRGQAGQNRILAAASEGGAAARQASQERATAETESNRLAAASEENDKNRAADIKGRRDDREFTDRQRIATETFTGELAKLTRDQAQANADRDFEAAETYRERQAGLEWARMVFDAERAKEKSSLAHKSLEIQGDTLASMEQAITSNMDLARQSKGEQGQLDKVEEHTKKAIEASSAFLEAPDAETTEEFDGLVTDIITSSGVTKQATSALLTTESNPEFMKLVETEQLGPMDIAAWDTALEALENRILAERGGPLSKEEQVTTTTTRRRYPFQLFMQGPIGNVAQIVAPHILEPKVTKEPSQAKVTYDTRTARLNRVQQMRANLRGYKQNETTLASESTKEPTDAGSPKGRTIGGIVAQGLAIADGVDIPSLAEAMSRGGKLRENIEKMKGLQKEYPGTAEVPPGMQVPTYGQEYLDNMNQIYLKPYIDD